MKRVLVIRTADKEFGEQLAKNFNRSTDQFFQTFVFSEPETFKEFAKTNIINVLLCDEDISLVEGEDLRADLMINLTEVNAAGEETVPVIFKYQPSDSIMKQIRSYYDDFLMPDLPKEKPDLLIKKLSCVCSPVGGAYSSTFALALASYYSRTGRTIFLTFDPFFTLPHKEKNTKEGNLSDLLLLLDPGEDISYTKEKMVQYISSCTEKHGDLEVLSGVAYWFEICELDDKIMHSIIDAICNTGYYQNAVFDMGIFGRSCLEALYASNVIYVPIADTPLNNRKYREFKRQFDFSGNVTLLEKIKGLNIPEDEKLKGEYDYSDLLEGKLGKYIRTQNL